MCSADLFETPKPLVGMVHLPALPGAPAFGGDVDGVIDRAVSDATRLVAGGVDGVLLENYGDVPFYPDSVPKWTVASMTRVGLAVADTVDCPIGINVLRNDAAAALSIAAAIDADFVRVNIHTGVRATDQGLIEGVAHETLRLRDQLGAETAIFADLDVKHAAPVSAEIDLETELCDLVERGLADAVLVSGSATGKPVSQSTLAEVVSVRTDNGFSTPILVGSGVDAESVSSLLAVADGAIVGTALKENGHTTNPVDSERVRRLVAAAETARN